jgi:hypothetical protein
MGYKSSSGEQALVDFGNKFPQDALPHLDLDHLLSNAGSSWVGREKTRYDFVLKYLSGHATNRGYYVHSFQDKNGNRFLSFLDCETITIPNREHAEEYKISAGDCFSCKATVNRHSVNTFRCPPVADAFKETVLNRIKFKAFIGRKDTVDNALLATVASAFPSE